MAPTKEEIVIIVAGQWITDKVPVQSIRVTNERGSRSGSASFVIEDGGSLDLSNWQSLLITESDVTTVIFAGFITEVKEQSRGIQLDYDIQATGRDSLLGNTIVNGNFTGTDDEILAALLAGAYPDFSGLFDFSSNVTPYALSDLDFQANNLDLSAALEDLADLVDADYFTTLGDGVNLNYMKNPNIDDNGNYYGGTIAPNGFYQPVGWNSANVVWGAAFGEGGDGGMQVTSQFIVVNEAYWRIGKQITSDPFIFSFIRDDLGADSWVSIRFRAFITHPSTTGASVVCDIITYDEGGSFYAQDTVTRTVGTNSWGTAVADWDLSDTAIFPAKGTYEIQCALINFPGLGGSPSAFTVNIDNVIVTIISKATPPLSGDVTYFDGDTTDASWLGTPNDSISQLFGTPPGLNWGDAPSAPFDIDIGVGGEFISDLDYNQFGADGINTVIIIGGTTKEDFDFVYPGNGELTHFDLELPIIPEDGNSQITVYKNTGSDGTPSWTVQTVGDWHSDDFSGSNTVLYDNASHWLLWETAPSDLLKSWRVVGQVEKLIRTVVTDDENIDEIGFQLADVVFDNTITSDSEAMAVGNAELANRSSPKSITFTTYEPGLQAGQQIDITDSTRGISETMIIQKIERHYLGGGYAIFDVECGVYTPNAVDIIVENHNIGLDRPPFSENVLTQLRLLIDDDGAYLLDDEGRRLFDSIEI